MKEKIKTSKCAFCNLCSFSKDMGFSVDEKRLMIKAKYIHELSKKLEKKYADREEIKYALKGILTPDRYYDFMSSYASGELKCSECKKARYIVDELIKRAIESLKIKEQRDEMLNKLYDSGLIKRRK